MELKYIGSDGVEHTLSTAVELTDAIKQGKVTAASMVFEATKRRWVRADTHSEFLAILHPPALAGDSSEVRLAQRSTRLTWLFLAAGFVLIVVGGNIAGLGGNRVGYLVGEALAYTAIVALAVHFSLKPKDDTFRTRARRDLWVGISCVATCSAVLGKGIWDEATMRTDITAIQTRMDKLVETATNMANGKSVAKASSTPLPQISGQTDLQIVASVIDRDTQRSLAITAAYQNAVRSAKMDEMLTPETLSSPEARSIAEARVPEVIAAIDKWEADASASLELDRREIEGAGLSPSSLAEALSGLHRSTEKTREFIKKFAEVERGIVGVSAQIVELANMSNPQADRADNRLLFAKAADLARYNSLLDKVRVLVSRENELTQQRAQQLRRVRDELKANVDSATAR